MLQWATASGASLLLPAVAGCSDEDTAETAAPVTTLAPPLPSDPASKQAFVHGVASGDPLTDRVILWTRVTPTDPAAAVEVEWVVGTDAALSKVVASGKASTDASRDFTVNVDATGLQPGVIYFYRFLALGGSSPVGRTRTAAASAARLRLGVVSCASLAHGYFHAYRALAKQADLDVVLHLGDYIYEYGSNEYGKARPYEPPTELLTLADYRTRYAQYRRDPDLQALHLQHPMIAVWDDHEIADNGWREGAENHQPDEGPWADRKAAAQQAYFEWMPIRPPAPGRVWRSFSLGGLVDLLMLDTRYWGRDEQVDAKSASVKDPARSILGADQEAWVAEQLAGSKTAWRMIGQQVVLTQVPDLFAGDSWSGYAPARARMFDAIGKAPGGNVVVLTGDIHSSWVNELTPDPKDATVYDPATGKGAIGVEFVVPAVTSPGGGAAAAVPETLAKENPNVRYVNFSNRGFVVLDVTAAAVQADFFHYPDPEPTEVTVTFAHGFVVKSGQTRPEQVETPASPLA